MYIDYNQAYKKAHQKFLASQRTKADVFALLCYVGINWIKSKEITDNLYPYFWIDKGDIILNVLMRDEIIFKETYILAIIRNWFEQAWESNSYEIRDKFSKWSIKKLSL